MNNPLLVILLLLSLFTADGCRRRNLVRSAPPVLRADSTLAQTPAIPALPTDTTAKTPEIPRARPGIEEARANVAEIDFKYLAAKSKLSFKSKDQDINNANVTTRVQKDSLIWMSVSVVGGIEVARIQITRDSVTILDKIHREYSRYDFQTLSQRFNFAMNYDLLQALIVGNLPLPRRPAQKIKNERDYLLLRQSDGKVLVDNYIGEEDRKLKKLMLTEQPTKNTLRLDYKDFTALNSFVFPYTSLVTLNYQSGVDGQFYETLLQIRHSKVELVDKAPGFPFSIPSKYDRRQ